MMAIDGKHCLWCGRTLNRSDLPGQLYCSAGHRTKQREHRTKLLDRAIVACPTPQKMAYPYRGTAFRAAATYRQYAYLCGCGVYHLTSNPGRRGRRTLGRHTVNQLARELRASSVARSRPGPTRPTPPRHGRHESTGGCSECGAGGCRAA